ncbi:MAG: DUF2156 domain-containing protein [Candidatus Thermoplasmatota archaeon]|nr:DUF2156 domain-containing protein [Candidatus Thermoplasmatota archaeon]
MITLQTVGKDKLLQWLKNYSRSSSAYLTLNEGIKYFSASSIEGYLGYVEYANVAVAFEPVCNALHVAKLIHEFKLFCRKNKLHVCFFSCAEEGVKIFKDCGFKILYIGTEPFVALDKFTTLGSKMQSIRRGINHAKRVGICVEECFSIDDKIKIELDAVTKDWLRTKKMPELSFMVGRLSFDPEKRYFIARKNGQAIAFAVYNPIYATKSYYLDLNRRMMSAPSGTMEYLIAESFEKLMSEGIERVYLGLSPFSNIQDIASDNSNTFVNKLMKFLYEHFDFFYSAKSEYFFKQKFSTGWEKRCMCYYPRISLRMLYAIFLSFCPGGIKELISYKLARVGKRLK